MTPWPVLEGSSATTVFTSEASLLAGRTHWVDHERVVDLLRPGELPHVAPGIESRNEVGFDILGLLLRQEKAVPEPPVADERRAKEESLRPSPLTAGNVP